METMSLEEFKKKYMSNDSKWDFSKFKIVCNKCNSEKVEFNGEIEHEHGWYEGECELCELKGQIVIKCHDCGNAFSISSDTLQYGKDE